METVMKFKPRPRYGSFVETDRKRTAVLRAQKRERDRLPLFAADIARSQPTVDEIMLNRALAWALDEQAERDRLARCWRIIRRDIAALPQRQRRAIAEMAARYGGPLDHCAYAYFYREITGYHHPGAPCGMGGKPSPARQYAG